MNTEPDTLQAMYIAAAEAAHRDGVDPASQESLANWIQTHCRYRPDTEFFLVLGIGREIARLRAAQHGK